ncbi:glycosyltransferase family 4 protein [filamentous cyanobacterium LEGE 11480]|uniref:Glycosyltransferase family 4 protein n=1 Tax=Romeriopsis navalis LEGE 11480 TaxID=2777977 RepID=A0A928Z101_9CYAN|nr:glycosyltransferase family 4 protein [Romeriopsis navalis]MBE9028801.1 glycosyltransferase family 4 protein [Romeriopsis navalis LEGE 11480]
MKALLLNTYDSAGGAARAAARLHQGLRQNGIEAQMLTQAKTGQDASIHAPQTRLAQGIAHARLSLDALPLKAYRQRANSMFSVQWLPERLAHQVQQINPDIINIHWINEAFVRIETLAKLRRPIVWSLHDMWTFTGGCHYTYECDRYHAQCGACPQLKSHTSSDLSHRIWKRKQRAWRHSDLTIVALSQWLGKAAQSSSLLRDQRVEIIPNGIDTDRFQPLDQRIARQVLRLPQDKQLVLFGAMAATSDRRKGFHLLQPALTQLSQNGWHDRLELIVCGSDRPDNPPEFGLPVHYLGRFQDDLSLALLYAAADVFVLPSTQENLSNMVMESLACGTPTVGFNIGGNPDLIEHQRNGYLARPYEIDDLAQGIAWVLQSPDRKQQLRVRSRAKVEQEFTQAIQAQRYQTLFEQLLPASGRTPHHA